MKLSINDSKIPSHSNYEEVNTFPTSLNQPT